MSAGSGKPQSEESVPGAQATRKMVVGEAAERTVARRGWGSALGMKRGMAVWMEMWGIGEAVLRVWRPREAVEVMVWIAVIEVMRSVVEVRVESILGDEGTAVLCLPLLVLWC
jgi:hypothetical protein